MKKMRRMKNWKRIWMLWRKKRTIDSSCPQMFHKKIFFPFTNQGPCVSILTMIFNRYRDAGKVTIEMLGALEPG